MIWDSILVQNPLFHLLLEGGRGLACLTLVLSSSNLFHMWSHQTWETHVLFCPVPPCPQYQTNPKINETSLDPIWFQCAQLSLAIFSFSLTHLFPFLRYTSGEDYQKKRLPKKVDRNLNHMEYNLRWKE